MGKVIVFLVESSPPIAIPDGDFPERKHINLRSLSEEQKDYFREAHAAFLDNVNWWEFDGPWFFNSAGPEKSPLYDLVSERGKELVEHPLWNALMELWLALGVNQGKMAAPEHNEIVYFYL